MAQGGAAPFFCGKSGGTGVFLPLQRACSGATGGRRPEETEKSSFSGVPWSGGLALSGGRFEVTTFQLGKKFETFLKVSVTQVVVPEQLAQKFLGG